MAIPDWVEFTFLDGRRYRTAGPHLERLSPGGQRWTTVPKPTFLLSRARFVAEDTRKSRATSQAPSPQDTGVEHR